MILHLVTLNVNVERVLLLGARFAPVWVLVIFLDCSCWALNGPLSCPGENPLPPDDPSKEQMGKTEVSLTLTNKFDVPGEANAEMDARTLLLK